MALKNYEPHTMVGNWSEDRAPTLSNGGVIADYGDRSLSTCQRDANNARMQPVSTSRAHRLAAQALKGGLYSMTRPDSWAAASTERHAEDTKATFRSVLPRAVPLPLSKDWSTDHRDAYGRGDGLGKIARLQTSEAHRGPAVTGKEPWVTGRPGGRAEKGKNTTGAMGEVFKTSEEPQHDTAAQRSWLYHEDPMLTLKKGGGLAGGPGCTVHASAGESKSLHGLGSGQTKSYDPEANNERSALLTKAFDRNGLPPHGRTVFLDD